MTKPKYPTNYRKRAADLAALISRAKKGSCEIDAKLWCILHRTRYVGFLENPITGQYQARHFPDDTGSTTPRQDDVPTWSTNLGLAFELAKQCHFVSFSITIDCRNTVISSTFRADREDVAVEESFPITKKNNEALTVLSVISTYLSEGDTIQFRLSQFGSSRKLLPVVTDEGALNAMGERTEHAARLDKKNYNKANMKKYREAQANGDARAPRIKASSKINKNMIN